VLKFIFSECTKQNDIFSELIHENLACCNFEVGTKERELEESLCVDKLVCRMQVVFVEPEAKIIMQDDPMEVARQIKDQVSFADSPSDNIDEFVHMYLIAKGSCNVEVKIRHFGEDKEQDDFTMKVCTLQQNQHFGEISCLFRCSRTASVLSNFYSNLSALSAADLKELALNFPNIYE